MESFWSFSRDLDDLNTMDEFITTNRQIRRLRKAFRRRFDPMTGLNDDDFKIKYRFNKENMRKLIENVRDDLEGDNPNSHFPVEFQVMAAIRHFGGEPSEVTAAVHGLNQQIFSKVCRRVSTAFASKSSRYIRMPVTLAEKEKVINDFHTLGQFPQVIGAIGSTQVKIMKCLLSDGSNITSTEDENYVNVQVVCDASLKIRDIDCRLRNGLTDWCIFRESRIKERFEQNEFRGRLIGDSLYTCTPYLFTPLLRPNTSKEIAYNKSHIITCSPVEKCFQDWKKRFKILNNVLKGSLILAKNTIIGLAVLHNMAIEMNDSCCEFDSLGESTTVMDSLQSNLNDDEHLDEQAINSRSMFIEKYF